MLTHKHILLGVTGGIAAYKACELASALIKQHADVKDTDEYWAGVVADAEVLEQRYGKGNKHMHNIILEVLDALDERGKKL